MEQKMTYVNALTIAIAQVGEGEVAEKLTALKEQLERKTVARKPRVNTAKIELAETAFAVMEKGVAYRVAELAKLMGVSTQKLTPAIGLLVEDGRVTKEVVKRITFYTAQDAEEEAE
jgi:hypothetical protein